MSYEEIDFAERLGDDDIDIDIDFETGQNDEDYILEDVNSDVGHEEAVISNDDVMIDDENVSYPMDDIDAVQEEHIEMEDADVSDIPVTELNKAGIDTTLDGNAPLYSAGLDEASETVIHELLPQEEHLRDIEAQQISGDRTLIEETEFPEKSINADSTLSPPIHPIQHEPDAQIGADLHIPPSDPAYSPSFNADTGNQDPTDPVAASEIAAVAGQTQDELEVKSGKDHSTMLVAEKIIVVYRSAEYALFSSSESDDPDTFFLKDGNLVNASLADLLAGLREIIHEDLGSEDELCLAVEDLGIEISETCMSVHEVNLANVMDLHEKLLRNDGVQSPGPLYVTLSTKLDFAKRLANLAAGAADGKGMSDLISWDEESENFEDNEQSAHVGDEEAFENTHENAEGLNESTESHENDRVDEGAVEEQPLENVISGKNTGNNTEDAEAPEDNNREQLPEHHDRPATSDNTSPLVHSRDQRGTRDHRSTTQTADVSNYSKDGLDEDGDLIDYEDEEFEQSRETSASANIDSSGKQNGNSPNFIKPCTGLPSCCCPPCMRHPLIYDEENIPGLDQRSLSPSGEEDEHHVQPNSNIHHNPSTHSDYNSDDEDENFSGYQDHEYEGDEAFAHEQTGEENVHDGEDFHASYDGIIQEDEGKNGNVADGIATNAGDFSNPPEPDHQQEAKEKRDDDHEEIDYNTTGQDLTDIGHADHSIASAVENQRSKSFTVSGDDQDADEISYEEAEILDSNESERTLIADESAQDLNVDETGQEHDDEINYDTDDQQDLNNPSEQKATNEASPIANGHTAKRQRVDTEDATDRASKQSKRTRS